MVPVSGNMDTIEQGTVAKTARNCLNYHLEAFMKVSDLSMAQKEEIADFPIFAFIDWSERNFVMGPVSGDMSPIKPCTVAKTARNGPKYHLEAFLKVSDPKRGSESRNNKFSKFRLYKLE